MPEFTPSPDRVANEDQAVARLFAIAERRPLFVRDPDELHRVAQTVGRLIVPACEGIARRRPDLAEVSFDPSTELRATTQGANTYATWLSRDELDPNHPQELALLELAMPYENATVNVSCFAWQGNPVSEVDVAAYAGGEKNLIPPKRFASLQVSGDSVSFDFEKGGVRHSMDFDFLSDTYLVDGFAVGPEREEVFETAHELLWELTRDIRASVDLG